MRAHPWVYRWETRVRPSAFGPLHSFALVLGYFCRRKPLRNDRASERRNSFFRATLLFYDAAHTPLVVFSFFIMLIISTAFSFVLAGSRSKFSQAAASGASLVPCPSKTNCRCMPACFASFLFFPRILRAPFVAIRTRSHAALGDDGPACSVEQSCKKNTRNIRSI